MGQVEGDLVLKCGPADQSATWCSDALRLTIVKQFGDSRYFHAARDYIMENNTRLYTAIVPYESGQVHLVILREEATLLRTVETYWRNPRLLGIDEVIAAYPNSTVAINGNMTFECRPLSLIPPQLMTSRCHGRLVSQGILNTDVSSDNVNPPDGSVLAGPEGKHVSMRDDHVFAFGKGRVPLSPLPSQALGGLSTDYPTANPTQMIGAAPVGAHRMIFTATCYTVGSFTDQGFADLAESSGVPHLVGGSPHELLLLKLDGGSSLALAYKSPNNMLSVRIKGGKHAFDLNDPSYYKINTYVLFHSTTPR